MRNNLTFYIQSAINNETGRSVNFFPVSRHNTILKGYDIMIKPNLTPVDAECQSYKKCTKCGEEKPATKEYFHAQNKTKDGIKSVCKICRAKENIDRNKEFTAKKREHYAKNKDRLLVITRASYLKNADQRRAYARDQHWKNRDRNLKRMQKNWKENNAILNERRRPKSRERHHLLYGKDLAFTLKHRVKALIRRTLRFNKKKDGRMKDILGYSVDELRQHIENQFSGEMSWEKFLQGEIHLDHKIPINFFKPESVDDPAFKECWDLSNLQPLWARDNLSKGAKYYE